MVEDVDTTLEWYKKILDTQEIVKIPSAANPKKSQWALIQCGDVQLMFQLRSSLTEEIPVFKGVTIGASLTLYVEVDNVQKLHDDLKSKKVEFVQEMHTTFYGSKECAIKDCNGYVLAFSQPKEE